MNEQLQTPHEIALKITKETKRIMDEGNRNKDGLSSGAQGAARLVEILKEGPCSDCARLRANARTKAISCNYEVQSPQSLARNAECNFLHQLSCDGHESLSGQPVSRDTHGTSFYQPAVKTDQ